MKPHVSTTSGDSTAQRAIVGTPLPEEHPKRFWLILFGVLFMLLFGFPALMTILPDWGQDAILKLYEGLFLLFGN